MSYTPIPENVVTGSMPGGLPGTALDLPSWLSKTLAASLSNPTYFAMVGAPTSTAQYQAGLLTAATAYIAAFPFALPAGQMIAGLVQQYTLIWLQQLENTPLDASGRLNAGMIADHLGDIPSVNGALNLSQFEPVATPAVTTIDPYDPNAGPPPAPANQWPLWGWMLMGFTERWVLLSQYPTAMAWNTAPYFGGLPTSAPAQAGAIPLAPGVGKQV